MSILTLRHRWWWISFLSPVFSVMIAVLLWYATFSIHSSYTLSSLLIINLFNSDRTFHSFQIGLLFGSLAGTISHAIVWFNLIGYDEHNNKNITKKTTKKLQKYHKNKQKS